MEEDSKPLATKKITISVPWNTVFTKDAENWEIHPKCSALGSNILFIMDDEIPR